MQAFGKGERIQITAREIGRDKPKTKSITFPTGMSSEEIIRIIEEHFKTI